MPDLAQFQDRFAASLTGEPPTDAPAGLSVYRRTVGQGLVAALAGNYPTIQRLMGDAWFAAEALAFALAHPPTSPVLAEYGDAFPAFLTREAGEGDHEVVEGADAARGFSESAPYQSPTAASAVAPSTTPCGRGPPPPLRGEERAYLADVALLDRAWTEAYLAADAELLAEPDFDQVPTLHPAARLLDFLLPAVTLWRLNRPPAPVLVEAVEPDWVPQACLVSRPASQVVVTDLDPAGHGFVAACLGGATFGEAAVALLERHPETDLAGLIGSLLAAGAFAA